ncbi:DUF1642 domain-containing protein [Lacticaseibacillus paracasei]|uniref:DUF1642 domain-containing protein n=1 Tax=Lacticaseibacillus paracasei TaxID=1597 RepID=UPI0013201851|nr:DUF1642 domain-containing protein [Lacticaseibacillus paracasei]QHC81180.1 DUF1642 domain-containing protein [Lacticaseibacillus paracasei]
MSEEKLYAVRNAEGKYWDFADRDRFKKLTFVTSPTTIIEEDAKDVVHNHGGHFVTLVEEPKKVVLSEKQAEIVEDAHVYMYPAKCITDSHYHAYPEHYIPDDTDNSDGLEELLMNAYVNGYTVKKEKKYNVKVPHVSLYYWEKPDGGIGIDDLNTDNDCFEFTEAEIEHYGLQDCEKEEVTDDEQ